MIRMLKCLVSCQGYFANIVTTLLAVALAKAKQITPTDRVSFSKLFYCLVIRILPRVPNRMNDDFVMG